ncbi:hypothetical protein L596_009387 [Steinernema carpocapsae]|uniref:Uncharacterized protein n=1 Tax=Steinernema carpocapsae TaxID=34508 RepID=A0A4V6A6M9_STECR|nr:hypothetical protein L596_009387 [Steinernema carpocapsae]
MRSREQNCYHLRPTVRLERDSKTYGFHALFTLTRFFVLYNMLQFGVIDKRCSKSRFGKWTTEERFSRRVGEELGNGVDKRKGNKVHGSLVQCMNSSRRRKA